MCFSETLAVCFSLIVSFDAETVTEMGKNKGILPCHLVSKAFH